MKHLQRTKPILTCLLLSLSLPLQLTHAAESRVALGAAGNFGVLAGSTVTSSGATIINGDLGLWPGSSVAGFPPGVVNGTKHVADPTAQTAQGDLTTAFNDAAGRSTAPVRIAGNIGGQTLPPGLYKSTSSLEISSGDLTLDGKGDPNAVFIFQIASTFITTSGRQVILINGADAKNIYWQVGTSATIGTTSVMKGTIMADQSITLLTGARLAGRALARIGAVTLQGNGVKVSRPGGAVSVFTSCDGPYHGLFYDTTAGVQRKSSGFVSLVLANDGSFSGHLVRRCQNIPISGHFKQSSMTAVVPLPALNATLSLDLDCAAANSQINGTLVNPNWQATLQSDVKGFHANTPVPNNIRGHYTLVIPTDPASPNSPDGAGYGALSLSSGGTVDFAGATADGQVLDQTVPISADGDWPLFNCLYQGGGSLLGWMKFTAPHTLNNSLTSWLKPAGGTMFPDGFSVETAIRGSRFVQPAAGTRILNFADAVVIFSGANLSADLVCPVRLTVNNTVVDQSNHALTMKIHTENGLFGGSFQPPGTQNTFRFHGAVLQSSNAGWGYFLRNNQSGQVYFGSR